MGTPRSAVTRLSVTASACKCGMDPTQGPVSWGKFLGRPSDREGGALASGWTSFCAIPDYALLRRGSLVLKGGSGRAGLPQARAALDSVQAARCAVKGME